MKNLPFIVMMLAFVSQGHSQTRAEYEHVMKKFMQFYNTGKVDSLVEQYSDIWGKDKKTLWTKDQLNSSKSIYGKILTMKYTCIDTVSDNNKVALFFTTTAKKKFMTGIVLDKSNKLETFRFETSSPFIDSVFAKNKNH